MSVRFSITLAAIFLSAAAGAFSQEEPAPKENRDGIDWARTSMVRVLNAIGHADHKDGAAEASGLKLLVDDELVATRPVAVGRYVSGRFEPEKRYRLEARHAGCEPCLLELEFEPASTVALLFYLRREEAGNGEIVRRIGHLRIATPADLPRAQIHLINLSQQGAVRFGVDGETHPVASGESLVAHLEAAGGKTLRRGSVAITLGREGGQPDPTGKESKDATGATPVDRLEPAERGDYLLVAYDREDRSLGFVRLAHIPAAVADGE